MDLRRHHRRHAARRRRLPLQARSAPARAPPRRRCAGPPARVTEHLHRISAASRSIGEEPYALALLGLIAPQMFAQYKYLLPDPIANDVKYQASAQARRAPCLRRRSQAPSCGVD